MNTEKLDNIITSKYPMIILKSTWLDYKDYFKGKLLGYLEITKNYFVVSATINDKNKILSINVVKQHDRSLAIQMYNQGSF